MCSSLLFYFILGASCLFACQSNKTSPGSYRSRDLQSKNENVMRRRNRKRDAFQTLALSVIIPLNKLPDSETTDNGQRTDNEKWVKLASSAPSFPVQRGTRVCLSLRTLQLLRRTLTILRSCFPSFGICNSADFLPFLDRSLSRSHRWPNHPEKGLSR